MREENRVINQAQKWIGYLEKKSNKELDDFTANAGTGNFTCFSRDYKRDTGLNLQGQPWCAMFVSEIFVQAYGLSDAKKLLCGSLYHNCQDGANRFKQAGRWNLTAQTGDIIFFTNGSRAYHTGIVTEATLSRVKTIEGNTSGASGVIENGGGVCQKSYSLIETRIMGFGRPAYNLVKTLDAGWVEDQYGSWYRRMDGSYPVNKWEKIGNQWYWFNESGYAYKSQWVKDQDNWYYIGDDKARVTGIQLINGKLYCFDDAGVMVKRPVLLTPDQEGALQYRDSENSL